jgi:CRP/FNR family transcriptional regulator/CRP/FNR family cyclic AMP-dependent transcriptional regulator
VEIVQTKEGRAVQLAVRNEGEFFGEMARVERETRSATLRALSDVRVQVLDRETFLLQAHADPALAYHLMQEMSRRIREASAQLAEVKTRTQD